MRFDVKEVLDEYGIDAAIAVHDMLSNPEPLTKEYIWEILDSMFPDEDSFVLKEVHGEDIYERKEAMKYYWNELRPDLLNGNTPITLVALTGKYYLAKYRSANER